MLNDRMANFSKPFPNVVTFLRGYAWAPDLNFATIVAFIAWTVNTQTFRGRLCECTCHTIIDTDMQGILSSNELGKTCHAQRYVDVFVVFCIIKQYTGCINKMSRIQNRF